jgi:50S ribosomal subunit-associated GTPase HflX
MTRSTLFDRLNQELESFGKKAHAARDEGKLQIELLRLRRRLDRTARDLGLLVHRRERGGEPEARRFDSLLSRLDDLNAEVSRLEKQIAGVRAANSSTSSQSTAPQGSRPVEAAHPVEVGSDRTDTP